MFLLVKWNSNSYVPDTHRHLEIDSLNEPYGDAQNALPAILLAGWEMEQKKEKSDDSPSRKDAKEVGGVRVEVNDAPSGEKRDWHDYKAMERDSKREGIGERGKAEKLGYATHELEKKMSIENGFNALLSDSISVNRSVPDIRQKGCHSKLYFSKLPTVSIILTFWNEYMSVLKRSIHSLINRSPPELIKEIILVDDGSHRDYLRKPLEDYIAKHFKNVRIIRLPRRIGPIGARSAGAHNATAEVLIFVNSRIETNYNWLPPLLEPIALNKRTAVCPLIDNIDHTTFQYRAKDEGKRGGFNWFFSYIRLPLLPEDHKHPTEPFKSPIMVGGVFAISSVFFWELGGYDEGLQMEGGEQFELSFKIWMCGGEMYDAPCSRVGQIYQGSLNHTAALLKNYKRVAEVWMDDYKKYLYQRRYAEFDNIDPGDLTKQIALRYKLRCKSFKWFMENVASDVVREFPPTEPPDYANGAIQNLGNPDYCVDTLQRKANNHIGVYPCAENLVRPQRTQFWTLSWYRDLRIRNEKNCMDVQVWHSNAPVWLWKCHEKGGNQYWSYDYKLKILKHGREGKRCLEMLPQNMELVVNVCNATNRYMLWNFGYANHTALLNYK
ncbi:N-acetylgalactosaminyltransferase 6-like [Scaptodrosophila lebanonensis]|uniref:Polypeptide N-acetylgalactosaminyltransferase n=1 Tax=Drosophila lebanonensis TaxID=7225 RepID=A0A6J2TBQ2_DROLE|nr:N-acetylgalactosaminyltransferase 6-like [Scaptodrosophila lebanonensis]